MARKTPRPKMSDLARNYYERYVRFSEQLHNLWIIFEIQKEILNIVETQSKDLDYQNRVVISSLSPVNSSKRAPSNIRGANIEGIIKRAYNKEIPETVFLNAVSLFESFIGDTAKIAYLNDPDRFLLQKHKGQNKQEIATTQENAKLLEILIESADKDEALERYVEEKLRGIFYGNPVELFTKDRLRFQLDSQMTSKVTTELQEYTEIVARRNIIVHNLGKVDRKYLREVANSPFLAGKKITIDEIYVCVQGVPEGRSRGAGCLVQ